MRTQYFERSGPMRRLLFPQVRVSAPSHHPFFVYGRSWASLSPRASLARYGLQCSLLTPGDVCISLTQTNR